MKSGPKKANPIVTTELCKFGCGNVAKFVNFSGGLLCLPSASKCPVNKKKNTGGTGVDAKARYDKLSIEKKNNMTWSKGLTAESDVRVAQQKISRHASFVDGKWEPHFSGVAVNPALRWKRNYIPYTDSTGKEFKLESMHEWEVANLLDQNKIFWTRPNKIKISSGVGYEPDFYLRDYDIYLDPKTKWKGKPTSTSQGYALQDKQLEKIKQCEAEHNIKCLILWSEDKRSHTWEGILAQIEEYNATVSQSAEERDLKSR